MPSDFSYELPVTSDEFRVDFFPSSDITNRDTLHFQDGAEVL